MSSLHLEVEHQNDSERPDLMILWVRDDTGARFHKVILAVADGHLEVAVDTGNHPTVIDIDDDILIDTTPMED